MRRTFLLFLLFACVGPRFALAAEKNAAKKLDFNRDVRPILSENCFQCHGFDEKARQAELRLDTADSAYAEHDDVIPIVPLHPEQSEVWRRITSTDESEMMPPPDSHRALKSEQKAIIKLWIEQGAPYAKHWSFIPPVKATIPEVSDKAWPKNEIDNFILARLDAEKLTHAPEADRYTLIRRLTLDLTGLPPSAEDVEAFVADKYPNAYEKLVDRLLADRHFGERMALVWLDAARYADTNGFSIDGGRHMWLWRDWVINAFNTNMPYDQFVREQIAGDLLPNRTEAQLVATGFERNNMNTHEGGTIPEENLTNYNVDRVKTLGESILGLTLACAQCHNHKFDPLTQRDFYQMFAYFNSASDAGLDGNAGINSRPFIEAKTVLQTDEIPTLQKQIAALKEKLANISDADVESWVKDERAQLGARGNDFQLHKPELIKISTPNIGSGFDIEPPNFVKITVPTGLLAYDISMRLPNTEKPITGLRVVFHPDANGARGFGTLPKPGEATTYRKKKADPKAAAQPGAPKPTFVLTAFSASAESVPGDQVNLNRLIGASQVTADSWLETYRPEFVLDTRNENGWSPDPASTGPVHITVTFDQVIDPKETPFLTTQLNFGHGNNLIASHFEIYAMTGTDDGSTLPQEIIDLVQNHESGPRQLAPTSGATAGSPSSASLSIQPRTSEDQSELRDYYAKHADATRRDRIDLANLEERLAVLTQKFPTMVMDIAPQPRETHILRRGDYSQPTEKVSPGTPAVLPLLPPHSPHQLAPTSGATAGSPSSAASTRLDLANWLTMPENPLPARVEVNRVWQILFGAGLVTTPADFGAQGAYPSHAELLDWLAVDFREHNWDVKRLIKKIVTSATYRQSSDNGPRQLASASGATAGSPSSAPSADLLARDPQNRLLARGPRFRLPAEFIRDGALKTSGLLVDRLGGPSVNPYTPGNLWREISHYGSSPATAQTFEQDHGEKLYRRSMYSYWKRTVPPPNMVAFDAPNREICTIYRSTTTTPLQALVLLNDVQFVEASRAFAERIIEHSPDETENLRWAFEECVSRRPTDRELAVLTNTLQRERTRYTANPTAAQKYLANGESIRNEKIPAPEHAAWSQVVALLLNLSETVTRN